MGCYNTIVSLCYVSTYTMSDVSLARTFSLLRMRSGDRPYIELRGGAPSLWQLLLTPADDASMLASISAARSAISPVISVRHMKNVEHRTYDSMMKYDSACLAAVNRSHMSFTADSSLPSAHIYSGYLMAQSLMSKASRVS